jgi:hypothetical protein
MPLHNEAGSVMAQAVSRWHLTAEARFLLYDEEKMKLSSNEGDSGSKKNTHKRSGACDGIWRSLDCGVGWSILC